MITVEYLAPGTGASAVDLDDFLDQFATDSGFSTLQAAVTAAAGKHLYVNRDWTLNTAVSLPAETNIIIGPGVTITQSTNATSHFTVAANGVTIRGGTLIGNNTQTASSAAVLVTDSDDLMIESVRFEGCRFGIRILKNCDNFIIRGNRFIGGHADGTSASDIIIHGSSSNLIRRGTVSGNFCLSNNDNGIFIGNGFEREIVISGNEIVACDDSGVEITVLANVTRRYGITTSYVGGAETRAIVANNVVRNCAYAGLYSAATSVPAGMTIWTGNHVSQCGFGMSSFDGSDSSLRAGILSTGGGIDEYVGNTVVDCYVAAMKLAPSSGWSTSSAPRITVTGGMYARTLAINVVGGSYNSPGRNLWLTNKPGGIVVNGGQWIRSAGINVYVESSDVNAGSIAFSNMTIEVSGALGGMDLNGKVSSTDLDLAIVVDGCTIIGLDNTTNTAANSGISWTGNVQIRNCWIKKFRQGVSAGDTTTAVRRLDRPCDNNVLEDCFYGLTGGGTGSILVVGNRFKNCTTATNGVYYNGALVGEKFQFSTTASPSVGTWAVGDIAWDSDVAAAAVPGWVCTTAGTSGTWKAMAAIAA